MLRLNVLTSESLSIRKSRLGRIGLNSQPDEIMLSMFIQEIETHHRSWKSSCSPCKWSGVVCNPEGQVRSMFWNDHNLRGCNLTWRHLPQQLAYLDLSSNKLSGPVSLDEFPRDMRAITLSNNKFTGNLKFSECPPMLRSLYLDGNKFQGIVYIHDLSEHLCRINLSGNSGLYGWYDSKRLPEDLNVFLLDGTYIFKKPSSWQCLTLVCAMGALAGVTTLLRL